MSIKSIVKINEGVGVDSKPKGWIVREIYDSERDRSIVFEYGIYIDENTFLGVPLHYSFKSKLIPTKKATDDDKYNYYLVDDNTEFGLSTFKNKKGKVFPVLVEPSEKHPAMKMASIAFAPDAPNKVIYASLNREDNIIIRDYIDKDRNCIAVIIGCTNTELVNPEISMSIQYSVVKSKVISTKKFDIGITSNITNMTGTTDKPVETQFIKFKRFIRKPRVNNTTNSNNATDSTVTETEVQTAE